MSFLSLEIKHPNDSQLCVDCGRSFDDREPGLEVIATAAGEQADIIAMLCFECFMDLPDELVQLRTEFANACMLADERRRERE